jgi:hypothetical protein
MPSSIAAGGEGEGRRAERPKREALVLFTEERERRRKNDNFRTNKM